MCVDAADRCCCLWGWASVPSAGVSRVLVFSVAVESRSKRLKIEIQLKWVAYNRNLELVEDVRGLMVVYSLKDGSDRVVD